MTNLCHGKRRSRNTSITRSIISDGSHSLGQVVLPDTAFLCADNLAADGLTLPLSMLKYTFRRMVRYKYVTPFL